jgi:amino acid adenylation domain-containing protein
MTEQIFPTSFGQRRLWFLDQFSEGTTAYNLSRAFRLTGFLDRAALAKALQSVVARHDSLRTIFTSIDGEPNQVVLSALDLDLPISDLTDVPAGRREEAALRIAAEEASKLFNLRTGPLLRTQLVCLGPQDHLLVFTIHHIISDGWSMNLLFREMGELYSGFVAGSEPRMSPVNLQYSAFCRWQRATMTDEFLADELDYWKHKLQDANLVLELPTDHCRPAVLGGRGKSFRFDLNHQTNDKLKTLAQSENATPFMALLAAFQVLLSRYTSQDNILIGTPTAGRNDVELENLLGFFVNTLILRADLAPEATFRQMVRQARLNTLDALAHQNTPFEKLVEALEPDRSLNRNPLFQVMFVFQNAPKQKVELPGLVMQEIEFESGVAKFDLTLEIIDLGTLHCTLEYDSDLFEEATIQRMAGHLATLIEDAVATPGKKISELSLMTSHEVQQLVEWNDTTRQYPRDLSIHAAFEEQVIRTPEKTALIDQDRQISYRELNQLSDRLAQRLLRGGVRPGALVGVSLNRSIEMVVALLGILKTGAAYVPLEPEYPEQRLSFMIQDSRLSVVVTSPDFSDAWRKQKLERFAFDLDSLRAESEETPNRSLAPLPENRMYVMYTSGSTGNPKGVEGTHRASMNRFVWMWDAYPFSKGETCCQKTSLGFVDSIWEIFGPLLCGIPSVIVPNRAVIDPKQLVQVLSQYSVTRIVLVPSLLRAILEAVDDLQSRLPKLTLWSCSGEVLPADLVQRFSRALPNATLLNIYGSSEVAADVTWHQVTKDDGNRSVPIGRPISNVQIWILDRHLNRVPIGVPGELYVGGDCLALGYLGRAELTSQRFIAHQFEPGTTLRLFKTGDRGRYLQRGEIEYIGRTDNQVKIRGMRVELDEIEAVLATHPAVRDAVVIVDQSGQPRLTAYIAFRPGLRADAVELRRFLRISLPDQMIPSDCFVADSFPLLPSGKVDRRALKSQSSTSVMRNRGYIPPQTTTEERLAGIWGELLGIDKVSIADNFFELGGHSLMVMRIIARIRKIFEVEVPIRSMFEDPTIKGLAADVEKAIAKGVKVSTPISAFVLAQGRLRAQVDKMSREEVAELLRQVLREKSGSSSTE